MALVTFILLNTFGSDAYAHSNSVGYRNQAAGVLRFYIGSDHGSANTSEGYLKLTDPNGTVSYLSFREIGKSGEATASATCATSGGTIACPDSALIAKTSANGGNFFVTDRDGNLGAYGDSSFNCRTTGGAGTSNFWQYLDADLTIPGTYQAGYVACNGRPDFNSGDPTTFNCRSGTSADAKWQVPTGNGGAVCFGLDMNLDISESDLGIPSLTGASLEPADNSTGVSILQKLKIVFSEAVNVGSGVIKVIKTSTNEVIESINVTSSQVSGNGTDTINATWTNALENSTDYCVQIESTAFDSVSTGKGFAGISDQTTWNFRTNDLPALITPTPTDNASGVQVLQKLKLVFSETVNVGSGFIKLIKGGSNETIESIDVTGSQVTGTGTNTIDVTWTNPLEETSDYYVQIDSTAFTSVGTGQGYPGISDQTTWNFTTRDLPGMSSTIPADGATDVSVDSLLTMEFSSAMSIGSGNLKIIKTSDGSIFETIDITSDQIAGSGTTKITVTPTDFFFKNTAYHILLDAGALKDSTEDPHIGISDATTWNFTTEVTVANPLVNDPVVIGLVEAQAELANRAVFGSLVPVASRMMQFRRNRRSSNLSQQGIQVKFTNPEITKALSYAPVQALMEIEDGFLDRLARGVINPSGELLGKQWAIWSAGTIIIGKTDATASTNGSEFTTDGITIGVDKKIDNNRLFGMSVRSDREQNDVGVGSFVNTNSQGLTFYGSWSKDNKTYFDAAMGFNELIMDIQRTTSRKTVFKGERTGYQFYQTATLVREIRLGKTTLSPYANLALGYTRFGSYDEHGGTPNAALSFGSQHITLKKGHLGLQVDTQKQSKFGVTRPFVKIEYGDDKSTGSDITASYVIDPTTLFSTSWKNSQSTGWRLETGLDLNLKSGFIGISYERIEEKNTTSSDSTKVHADSIQIRALYRF